MYCSGGGQAGLVVLRAPADVQITRLLREAGKVLEITMLDHVIIGNIADDPQGKGFYSFREAGLI